MESEDSRGGGEFGMTEICQRCGKQLDTFWITIVDEGVDKTMHRKCWEEWRQEPEEEEDDLVDILQGLWMI